MAEYDEQRIYGLEGQLRSAHAEIERLRKRLEEALTDETITGDMSEVGDAVIEAMMSRFKEKCVCPNAASVYIAMRKVAVARNKPASARGEEQT